MLFSQPRIALLHACLALAQAAWITPFVLLAYPAAADPYGVLALAAGLLLGWMLALELLSRRFESPAYDVISLGLMALTSLLLVRVLLYGGRPAWDVRWLAAMVRDAFNFTRGLPPALVIVAANLLLWQRATAATSRDLTFFGVGVTFRLGMILLFVGGGVYAVVAGVQLIGFLWLYFAAGLAAVSLARIGEKAVEAQSAGAILPVRRLAQVLAAVGVTLGVSALASTAYTPAGVRSFLRLFAPVLEWLRPLLLAALIWLGRRLEPLFLWLERIILQSVGSPSSPEEAGAAAAAGEAANPLNNLPAWPFELLRGAFFLVLIAGAVIGLALFLLLYLDRVRRSGALHEAEEEGLAPAGRVGLGRTWAALVGAARLTRRLGVGRQLLAAISVQNIYANLARIAGRHGLPRPLSQPPDDYLPSLARVFPGQEPALQRITEAYMRVHYGDRPVAPHELGALRDDYRTVRAAEVARGG